MRVVITRSVTACRHLLPLIHSVGDQAGDIAAARRDLAQLYQGCTCQCSHSLDGLQLDRSGDRLFFPSNPFTVEVEGSDASAYRRHPEVPGPPSAIMQ